VMSDGQSIPPRRHFQGSETINDQLLISSIKVEVKKKHPSHGRTFSCFAAHLIEQDLF
jgi:hypothetical protein